MVIRIRQLTTHYCEMVTMYAIPIVTGILSIAAAVRMIVITIHMVAMASTIIIVTVLITVAVYAVAIA